MKRLSCLLVLCAWACGGSAPAPGSPQTSDADLENPAGAAGPEASPTEDAPESIAALDIAPPKKGQTALESRNIKMEFELTLHRGDAPAGLQSGTWSVEEQRSMQVREVGKQAISELSVVYGKRVAQPLLGIEKKPVTAGNKYLVKASGNVAAVTTLDGGKVDAEQRDAVLSEFGYVGRPSLLARIIGKKPAPGDQAKLSTREALALLGEIPGLNVDKTEVTLVFESQQDSPRKTATFKASVRSEVVSGPTHFEFSLEGPARVDVETGWVSSIELSGPIKPTGKVKTKKGLLGVKGKGTISIARSTTF